jgi:hypothetical protein
LNCISLPLTADCVEKQCLFVSIRLVLPTRQVVHSPPPLISSRATALPRAYSVGWLFW